MTTQVQTTEGEVELGTLVWAVYDLSLTLLLLFTVSDAFYELGYASYLWMLCYGLLVIRLIIVFPSLISSALRNRGLFFYASVCFASVLWSVAPQASIVSSVQLVMTLFFGFFLGLRYSIHNLVVLLFWSSFLLIILSSIHAATGIFPISQLDADGRLIGIFAHKSYLARQALICTVAGLALMFTENNRVGIVTRLCAIIALVLSAGMLLLSESMTNLLMLPIGTGLLVVLCRHRLPGQVVLWMTIGSVLSVALIPVSFALAGIDPVTALFEITGKDRTLTGRTIIWEIAAEQIGQAPFLGVGFDAFWQAPLYESERFRILNAGATSPSLHNFVLEILVGTGALGLCAALVHIGYSVRRNIRLWRATGSPTSACTVVLITMLVLLSLNTPGLSGQHEIQLILLTAFAVSAERGLRFLRRAQQ